MRDLSKRSCVVPHNPIVDIMSNKPEPKEAFPYKPPDEAIKQKYRHIFALDKPLDDRFLKVVFDKLMAALLLMAAAPILLLLKIAYVIEGWLISDNQGPMFFSYNAVSAGKVFPKYKIRLIKMKYIDQEAPSAATGMRIRPSGRPIAGRMSGTSSKGSTWMNCHSFTTSSAAI